MRYNLLLRLRLRPRRMQAPNGRLPHRGGYAMYVGLRTLPRIHAGRRPYSDYLTYHAVGTSDVPAWLCQKPPHGMLQERSIKAPPLRQRSWTRLKGTNRMMLAQIVAFNHGLRPKAALERH